MKLLQSMLAGSFAFAIAGCTSSSVPPLTTLPPAAGNGSVPAAVQAASGYRVTVFSAPLTSTKPDSLVQIGKSVFVGYGDTVGPDGTPGPGGKSSVEIAQYEVTGKLQKMYSVPGHNDGLLAYDSTTLWAMSNEDANPKLVVINVTTGAQKTYTAQPSLLNATGGLPHGGGLDDLALIGGKVYVSGSNPSTTPGAACAAASSTPGCPNGVTTGPFVYALSLNPDGATFDLTPVLASNMPAIDRATGAPGTFNITDTDSEVVSPDGSTLIVDGQQDAELAFVTNVGSAPSVSYLPLTLAGVPQQVDDTRFVPAGPTFALLTDTPLNAVYRIDGPFSAGDAYSAAQTMLVKLNVTSGTMQPIVSGFQAPHGLLFVSPQ